LNDFLNGLGDGDEKALENELKKQEQNELDELNSIKDTDPTATAEPETKLNDIKTIDQSNDLDTSIAKENAIAEKSTADFEAFESGEVNQFSPGKGFDMGV
jgi:hypothetical protein